MVCLTYKQPSLTISGYDDDDDEDHGGGGKGDSYDLEK